MNRRFSMKKLAISLAFLPLFGVQNATAGVEIIQEPYPPAYTAPAPHGYVSSRKVYATVINAQAITTIVNVPMKHCQYQPVSAYGNVPVLVGGAIGGAIGSQVGKGDGRTIATALGVLIGSEAGRDYQARAEQPICSVYYQQREQADGYLVTLKHEDRLVSIKMHSPPPIGSLVPINVNFTVN